VLPADLTLVTLLQCIHVHGTQPAGADAVPPTTCHPPPTAEGPGAPPSSTASSQGGAAAAAAGGGSGSWSTTRQVLATHLQLMDAYPVLHTQLGHLYRSPPVQVRHCSHLG
jgi:hypothetical protein